MSLLWPQSIGPGLSIYLQDKGTWALTLGLGLELEDLASDYRHATRPGIWPLTIHYGTRPGIRGLGL